MSDENENTPTPEDDQPESSADSGSDGQPVEPQDDAPTDDAPAEPVAEEGCETASDPESEVSDDQASALAAAMAAVNQLQGVADSASEEPPPAPDPVSGDNAEPFESPVLEGKPGSNSKQGIDLLSDVHMNVRIELGRTKMFVEDVLKLGDGAVVELDKLAGDPVDVFVNDRKVAKGEVLVLNDLFCVRISEIVDISAADD